MLTYSDMIEYTTDYLGGGADNRMQSYVRRAVVGAYQRVAMHPKGWRYYVQRTRVNLNGTYSTGTIEYTASTRTFVISDGSWPSWAKYGEITVSDSTYRVKSVSGTSLVVSDAGFPVSNIAAGTAYSISQTAYPLPATFRDVYGIEGENRTDQCYVTPEQFFHLRKTLGSGGSPTYWTVTGDDTFGTSGSKSLLVYPVPSADSPHEFLMRRLPRVIRYSGYSTNDNVGTVSISGTTVTGTSTAFTARMIGSVIRVGDSTTAIPTSIGGLEPYTEEFVITAVASATSLTIASAPTYTYSGVKYLITDPLDIDECMEQAVKRAVMYEIEVIRNGTDAAMSRARSNFDQELVRAWESDSLLAIGRAGIPFTSLDFRGQSYNTNYRVLPIT